MKKILCYTIMIALAVSLLFPAKSYADSPVTSTQFYTAYLDIDPVKKAVEMSYLDEGTARYLSEPENPLDIKAAVINAIGWDTKGTGGIAQIEDDKNTYHEVKDNAERYSDFIFGKSLDDLDFNTIPAHDLFCIGYLMVMDNYFEPGRAVPILEKASEAIPDSFTIKMITAIVKAQFALGNADEWNDAWELVSEVIQNKSLNQDIRPEAVEIILDYMILYKSSSSTEVFDPDQQADSPSSTPDKPISLTYFRRMPDPAEGTEASRDAEFYKELEKRTNIKLSFIDVSEDIMLQKLNIMAAAGDTPDLIEFPWQRYPGLAEKMASMDILIELDELISKSAPNLYDMLQLTPEVKNMMISDYDSHIYQIPGMNLCGSIVTTGPIIREDLLKKYGLAVPKTMAEWEKMLTVFRDGEDRMIPLSFEMSVFKDSAAFIGAFGIPYDFGVRDDKVFYGPIEESYRDFLSILNRWYQNGLLDPDFILLNKSQLVDRINTGRVGAFIGEADHITESVNALQSIDTSFELIPVQNPFLHTIDPLNTRSSMPTITEYGIAISSTNKYPEESMKWIDYAYSGEGHRLFHSEKEGIEPDNGRTVSELLRKLPEVPGYKTDKRLMGYEHPEQKAAVRLWSAVSGENHPSVMPPVSLTREESDALSAIMDSLSVYTHEMFAKFIIVDASPDGFDAYVEKAKKLGIDHAIEIMQTALDRYHNRLSELKINGETIQTDTKPVVLIEDEILLPIRFVIEGLGGSVAWNEKNKRVTGLWNDTVITVNLNSKDVMVDYEPKTLNMEVIAINQRTYVPAGFIQDALGVSVQWNENSRVVNILG